MKPEGGMYQAVTKVNGMSPVMFSVAEVDTFHCAGRQHPLSHPGQGFKGSAGVLDNSMIQDGWDVNLGSPLSTQAVRETIETSPNRQGSMDDLTEIGLTDSTPSAGKPHTWGSGQQGRNGFNTCLFDTPRSKPCRR